MRSAYINTAAALLATTAIAIGAVEIEANRVARSELRAVLERNHSLSVASVFAEPFTGQLILRGVALGVGSTHVKVGRMILPITGPTLISPAAAAPLEDNPEGSAAAPMPAHTPAPTPTATPAAAAVAPGAVAAAAVAPGTAFAENIIITSGQTTVRIKRIDMTGTTLTGADIAALVDPKSSEPAEARFKKLTATAIVVPKILIDDATQGSERHAAINQVLLSGAVAGKIAAGSAVGITFANKQGESNSTGSITAVQASAVDLVQFARVFTTIRSDDATPIQPLYDSVVVTGLKVTDEKKKSVVSLGTLKETGLKGRPLATDFITNAKTRTDKPTDAEQAAGFNDMANSFEIGSLEANDLAVRGLDDGGTMAFSLASVAIHDFARAKVGGFALRALRFDSPGVKFGVGVVDIGPFALPRPKSTALSEQDPKAIMPSITTFEMGDVDFDVVTPDKEKGGPPTRVQFKLDHTRLANNGEPGEIPTTSKLTIDSLSFDIPPNPGQAQALVDMGYQHLDMSAALATSYNAADEDLKIDNLMLNGANMGSLGLGVHLVNVSKGIISPNKEIAQASALAMLVKGLSLNVVNTGLFERALAWKAKQDGKTPDEERAFAVDFFTTKLPAAVDNNANAKLVGAAIGKFISAPKNLHISIVSKNGIGAASMGLLADPESLLDTLEVKATAND